MTIQTYLPHELQGVRIARRDLDERKTTLDGVDGVGHVLDSEGGRVVPGEMVFECDAHLRKELAWVAHELGAELLVGSGSDHELQESLGNVAGGIVLRSSEVRMVRHDIRDMHGLAIPVVDQPKLSQGPTTIALNTRLGIELRELGGDLIEQGVAVLEMGVHSTLLSEELCALGTEERVTIGEHDAVLDVDIDVAVSDLDAVHVLADEDVGDTGRSVGIGVLADLEGSVGDVADEILHEEACDLVGVLAGAEEAGVVYRVGVVRGMGENGAKAHGLATGGGMRVVSECTREAGGSDSSDEQTTHAEKKGMEVSCEVVEGLPDGEGGEVVVGEREVSARPRLLSTNSGAPRDAGHPY